MTTEHQQILHNIKRAQKIKAKQQKRAEELRKKMENRYKVFPTNIGSLVNIK